MRGIMCLGGASLRGLREWENYVIARRYDEAIFGYASPNVFLSIVEGSVRVPQVDASTALSMT